MKCEYVLSLVIEQSGPLLWRWWCGCCWLFLVQVVLVCPVSMVLLVQECSLVQVFSGAGVFPGASGPGWCLADIPPIPLLIANFNCTVRAPPIRFSQCESIHTSVLYQFGVVWYHFEGCSRLCRNRARTLPRSL